MVLSDNGKTSRYTYNAAGERIIKSHGDLEGVYINGAPQGITFHETEDYTIYPAPMITVTKNRFTKHYFIGDKRVASKLGVGKFSNVYGISGNNVTAGQKDYAARMMQIEKQREEYYKSLGTPPGVPTMKGATADPDNTHRGYNDIIGDLGDHSVPEGWVQRPKFNEKGDVPGPPIQWQKPENPDNVQPGYGYIPTDTTNTEEIFFYHSDHLGSTSYITDAKVNITQFDAYLPYGELLVDEHTSSEDMPYKFNGKELDQETGLYYYGARYMNPVISLWYGVDPMAEKYPNISAYLYCHANPIRLIDPNGEYDFEGTIEANKYYPVIAVFSSNLSDGTGALEYDHAKAIEAGMPVIKVDDMEDFANAMEALKNINSVSGAYTLNSHGTAGTADTEKNPAHFYIGNDMVTSNTDFSILKSGLEGRQVFIGACNVGALGGNGYELVENMSKQTSSTVIAPDHPLPSGYTYDGSNYLNRSKVIFPYPAIEQNGYIISSRGSMFDQIRNVTIDKTKGISWDVEPNMPFYLNPAVSNIYSSWY